MKFFGNLIATLSTALVVYLAYMNFETKIKFIVNDTFSYDFLPVIIAIIFIAGLTAGIFFTLAEQAPLKKKMKEYSKQLEKKALLNDEDSSKIKVLEAKIETLEKALQAKLDTEA